MRWTKQHSLNAVAARERRRIERANAQWPDEPKWEAPKPGKFAPDFTINIRAKSGDRVQLTASRFGKSFLTGEGIRSAREISRGIEVLIREMAL
jgi:hypothetical protein